jgi:hypothetical protein
MPRTKYRLTILFAICVMLHSAVARAVTLAAASCSQGDVQSAINIAMDGDVVSIPAGTCTWSGDPVVWSNKNIAVSGAGVGNTIITRNGDYVFYVAMKDASHGSFRISGMTVTGATTTAVIMLSSETCTCIPTGWRIDHIQFNYPAGSRAGVSIRGVTYGVIDHNQFNWYQGLTVIVAAFNPADTCSNPNWEGNYIVSQPLDIGTANAVYIEDNTYKSSGGGGIPVYDTSAGGGRAVFRHNTVTGGFYYSHWTRGCEIGGILHEVYNNTFIGNGDYGDAVGADYPARIEAGTGVFFNNTLQNFGTAPFIWLDDRRAIGGGEGDAGAGSVRLCDGTQQWDGNLGDSSAPGWPCLGQIGRAPGKSTAVINSGSKQTSSPFYAWNNGLESTCATGGGCTDVVAIFGSPAAYVKSTPHPNGDVDFVAHSPRPNYKPYTYPHPLVAGTLPAPPSGVHIVSQ